MAGTQIKATVDSSALRKRIGRLPEGFHGAIKKSLSLSLGKFRGDYSARRLTTHSPGKSVQQRTGTLGRALSQEVTGDRLDRLRGRIYFDATHITVGTIGGSPNTTYAHTLEFGATIVPKRAKWLTIPVGEGLTPAGVARYRSIADAPEGFFFRPDEDTLEGLFYVREVGTRLEFLYSLRKKVTIKPTLHLIDDWKAFRRELLKRTSKDMARFVAAWNEGRDG